MGAATGAGIGLLVGGPPGAVGGAVVGSLIKVGADFSQRQLSTRQRNRAGTALGAAADRVWHRLMAGERIREDDFFTGRSDGVSSADEVAEAVLIAVRDESEQRKVPYLGYLMANIAFEPAVGSRSAHALIAEAEALSYTQLVLLAGIARIDEFPLPQEWDRLEGGSLEAVTVLSQFEDLGYARRELIGAKPPEQAGSSNIGIPAHQVLLHRGEVLHSLMELARIPCEDVRSVADLLWDAFGPTRPGT